MGMHKCLSWGIPEKKGGEVTLEIPTSGFSTGGRQIESGAPNVGGVALAGYWTAVPSLVAKQFRSCTPHYRCIIGRMREQRGCTSDRRQVRYVANGLMIASFGSWTSAAGNGALEFFQVQWHYSMHYAWVDESSLVRVTARMITNQTTREPEYLVGSYTINLGNRGLGPFWG